MHTLGKITGGTVVKHDWFKAPQPGQKSLPLAERKLGVPFPHKEKILLLLYTLEEHRNKLIYGKPNTGAAEQVLHAFQELHAIIKSELEKQGVSIA